jgi:hypothetical protein
VLGQHLETMEHVSIYDVSPLLDTLIDGLATVVKSGGFYNDASKNAAKRGLAVLRRHYDNNINDTFVRMSLCMYLHFLPRFRL